MQTVAVERYIEMVRTMGIEDAYKQRRRGTGRTIRDVLALAQKISAGEHVVIFYSSEAGQQFSYAQDVLNRVLETLKLLGADYPQWSTVSRITMPVSGGSITLYNKSQDSGVLGHAQTEYKLHGN